MSYPLNMAPARVAQLRLHNQRIASTSFTEPRDAVRWMGAIQAQDYLGSLWAIALRVKNATERGVENAIADKTIVRTWPLRGTLHFVAANDVRWMLNLVAPRVIGRSALRYRQLELDEPLFRKCNNVLTRALRDQRHLTRQELASQLKRSGIATGGQRLIHIIGRAALEGLICHATRRGKQFTFALLDEWLPASKTLNRDETLAELANRYFASHGPATLQDFQWWSGLAMKDAKAALASIESHLQKGIVDSRVYWFAGPEPLARKAPAPASVSFLPAFDEFLVGYRDRSAMLDPDLAPRHTQPNTGGMLSPTIILNGRVVGTWRRMLKKGFVLIAPIPFTPLNRHEKKALAVAAAEYGAFLGLPARLK
jgi:hypothetical protein